MSSSPTWRQMFNAWEQAVAPGLEDLTASNGFRDLMAAGLKVNSGVAREMERMSRQWLHMWNLPAASDVRNLRRQITGLERELKAVRRQLEAATAEAGEPATNGRVIDLVDTDPYADAV